MTAKLYSLPYSFWNECYPSAAPYAMDIEEAIRLICGECWDGKRFYIAPAFDTCDIDGTIHNFDSAGIDVYDLADGAGIEDASSMDVDDLCDALAECPEDALREAFEAQLSEASASEIEEYADHSADGMGVYIYGLSYEENVAITRSIVDA